MLATVPAVPASDPVAWANALAIFAKNPAFWAIWCLLALLIFAWAYRGRRKE